MLAGGPLPIQPCLTSPERSVQLRRQFAPQRPLHSSAKSLSPLRPVSSLCSHIDIQDGRPTWLHPALACVSVAEPKGVCVATELPSISAAHPVAHPPPHPPSNPPSSSYRIVGLESLTGVLLLCPKPLNTPAILLYRSTYTQIGATVFYTIASLLLLLMITPLYETWRLYQTAGMAADNGDATTLKAMLSAGDRCAVFDVLHR